MPASDLGTLARAVGEAPTETKLSEALSALSKADGGTVTFDEFVFAVKRFREHCPRPSAAQLEEAFRMLDKSGTGRISIAEVKGALTTLGEPLGEEELEKVIAEIDVDKDGRVGCVTLARLLSV